MERHALASVTLIGWLFDVLRGLSCRRPAWRHQVNSGLSAAGSPTRRTQPGRVPRPVSVPDSPPDKALLRVASRRFVRVR